MKTKLSTGEDARALTKLQNKVDESEVLILGSNGFIHIEEKRNLDVLLARNLELINWKSFFNKLASREFVARGVANEKFNHRTLELIADGILIGTVEGLPPSTDPQFFHQLRISKLNARRELKRCLPEFEDLFV